MKTKTTSQCSIPKTKDGALTRVAFGLVWHLDAFFKQPPAFADHFIGCTTSAKPLADRSIGYD